MSTVPLEESDANTQVRVDRRIGRNLSLFAILALTCTYLAVMSGHNYSIDGLLIYRQALSIVQNFSLRFEVPVFWVYSQKTSISGIGLALIYAVPVFVATKLGLIAPTPSPSMGDWDLFYRDPVYIVAGAPVHILIAVATGYLVLWLVRIFGLCYKIYLLARARYGVASPALVYARGDLPEPALGLCLITGVLSAQLYRASRQRSALLASGIALVLGVLTRPVEGSFLLPILLLMVVPDWSPLGWRSTTYKDIAVVLGAYVLALVLTLLVDFGRFGSFTETGYTNFNWGTPVWIGVPGDLIGPSRGILWQFPLIVLAPLGLYRLWATPYRRAAIAMTSLIVMLFLNTALWISWWGAESWGARLFVPAWPLVAVLAAIGAASLRVPLRQWLTAVLFAGGVVWAIPATVTDLLGGYGGTYDGPAQSFLLSGYPPVGAWRFLHHVRAFDLIDSNAVDIIWFKVAHLTHNASLVGPVVLAILTGVLFWKALRLAQGAPELEERLSGVRALRLKS